MPRSPIDHTAGALPASLPLDDSTIRGGSSPGRVVRSGWDAVDGALLASGARRGGGEYGDSRTGSPDPVGLSPDPVGLSPDPVGLSPDPVGGGGGLVRGGVHEWLGAGGASIGGADWSPPLLLLAHLAGCAVRDALERDRAATVLWIGRRVWPYPRTLFDRSRIIERADGRGSRSGREGALLGLDLLLEERPGSPCCAAPDRGADLAGRSLFVDPGDDDGRRLWAIDTALRSPGVTAIVADGSGLGMAATRRLQLAAAASTERGGDAPLALLARPAGEAGEISAATTRWAVRRVARRSDGAAERIPDPRWDVDLLRVKGAQVFRPPVPPERELPASDPREPEPAVPALRVVEPDEIELRLGRSA